MRRDDTWEKRQDAVQECKRQAEARGLYHRGWRFWPPYACHRCGTPITAHQFAFARSCGGCDLGTSRTSRLRVGDRGWFILGRVQLENPQDSHIINPEWIAATTREAYPVVKPRPSLPRTHPRTRSVSVDEEETASVLRVNSGRARL